MSGSSSALTSSSSSSSTTTTTTTTIISTATTTANTLPLLHYKYSYWLLARPVRERARMSHYYYY